MMPMMILVPLAILPQKMGSNPDEARVVFANLFEGLILRTVVFFSCAWIFMNLFRGEVIDRSLHYYFLVPLRREVLVAGKYFAGLITSMFLCLGTVAVCLVLFLVDRGYREASTYLYEGRGLQESLTYLGITALACIGYGSVFLVIGLFFRNPMIPAAVIYGWEFINFLLPAFLKKISIIHYLHSLMPVPIDEGPFAIVAEATSGWFSIPGLLIMTCLAILIAGYRIRRFEIKYASE
jgi:ABC-type transport system involved in multi-copper enzyme maturation permease subunit